MTFYRKRFIFLIFVATKYKHTSSKHSLQAMLFRVCFHTKRSFHTKRKRKRSEKKIKEQAEKIREKAAIMYVVVFYHKFNVYVFSQVLGTPTEPTWPGIGAHEEFLSYGFPYYERESLLNQAPRLDMDGLDQLGKLLCVSSLYGFIQLLKTMGKIRFYSHGKSSEFDRFYKNVRNFFNLQYGAHQCHLFISIITARIQRLSEGNDFS